MTIRNGLQAAEPPVDEDLTTLGFDRDHNPVVVIDTDVPDVHAAIGVSNENGLEVELIDLREQRLASNAEPPVRATDTRVVTDVASFLAELRRRPLIDGESTLWGAVDAAAIAAIYDDHPAGEAAHREDRLLLSLQEDPDWKRWHALSGEFVSQETLGDHIEDLLHTIVSPDQADLLEVIDSIRASTSGEFESSINRANGSLSAVYRREVATRAGAQGQLEVPQQILLQLTPWEGHEVTYDVVAQFRLRVREGKLALGVKLKPTRVTKLRAWRDLCASILDAVDVPVYAAPTDRLQTIARNAR